MDSYWAVYKADDGVSGTGTWEEDIDPGVSTGLTEISMPHELLNMVGTIIVEPAAEEFNSTYSVETKEETFPQKINCLLKI